MAYRTDSVDTAAFIALKVDYPEFEFNPVTKRTSFVFQNQEQAIIALNLYESGAECSAKTLMAVRNYLFSQVGRKKA